MSPVRPDNDSEASWWLLLQREAAEIKRLVDPSGSRVGQSSPCSCNSLVSLWPSISTLPFVVGPHLWSNRSLSAPPGGSETVLFPTLMLFAVSKNTSNWTFLVPQHSLSSYLHVFPPSSSHLMADVNLHTLTPSCSYIFVNLFYWK